MFFFSALSAFLALLVAADSYRRKSIKTGALWALLTLAAYPIGVPAYLTNRTLINDETREGGKAWSFLKYFTLTWTFAVFVFGMQTMNRWSEKVIESDAIASGIDGAFSFIGVGLMWFIPVAAAMVIGFFVKNKQVETA